MNNILSLETKQYAIKTENFEGPLDLLCHLIDKNKMNINDIKISEITDQYIQYIKQMEQMNLDITSEFLVMASTLLYLKSKSLLPKQVEEEEELTEEELIRRIIEYKKYKEITKKLKEDYEKYSDRIFKMAENIELPTQKIEYEYNIEMIYEIYANIIRRNEEKINENAKNIEKIAITDTYTVADKVKQMFKELTKTRKFVFNKLFSIKQHDKQEVVTAFSGLLELSRRNKVVTDQEEVFGEIVVEKSQRQTTNQ
ncbi:MAG: segregation/condensation protein A [Clostridia bacterium]|nr:segregation/condensation protein A [Clostridia bacterium]